jgi:hypothetical protein
MKCRQVIQFVCSVGSLLWLSLVKTLSKLVIAATPDERISLTLNEPVLDMKIEIFSPMFYILSKLNYLFLTLVIEVSRKIGQNYRQCVFKIDVSHWAEEYSDVIKIEMD